MSDLNAKFKESKKRHESREKGKKKMIKSILLTEEVVLRKYVEELYKKEILFFQKNVDLSEIEKDYNVIHEENNPKFFKVSSAARDEGGDVVTIDSMYILVPKDVTKKTLCLFITRKTPAAVSIEIRDKDYNKTLQCHSDFYCEKEVYASISEYKFYYDSICNLQMSYPRDTIKIHQGNYNYQDAIKKHIQSRFLTTVFDFKVVASEEYQKYINIVRENRCCGIEDMISEAIKQNFDEIFCMADKANITAKVNGYTVKLNIIKKIETVKAEVFGKRKKSIGFVQVKTPVMMVDAKIYFYDKIFAERKLKLCADTEFKDELASYVNNDYVINC